MVAVILTAALLATMFLGCGGSNPAQTNTTTANTQPTAAAPASTPSGSPAPSAGTGTSAPPATPTPTPTPAPTPTPTPTPTPAPTSSFRFLAWGDSRDYPDVLASLSNQATSLNPLFTLYTGDAESNGFTTSGADAFIGFLNGSSNNGMSAKSFLIRGNHDGGNTAGWQAYYNFAATGTALGVKNFTALDTNLTYSFDYQNSHFVAVDVPGDVPLITSAQIAWIDSDLTAAESRGLTHAFVYWHGPIYCVETQHCGYSSTSGSDASQPLIDVVNKHNIISAMFFGHEHVLAYVHVDGTRISGLNHAFEEIVVGTAGAPLYACDLPARTTWCNAVAGFASVDVAGPAVTINYYQQGSTTPIKTLTFSK